MVEKKKRKSNVEGGKKLLKFLKNEREDLAFLYKRIFFFQKAMPHLLF